MLTKRELVMLEVDKIALTAPDAKIGIIREFKIAKKPMEGPLPVL